MLYVDFFALNVDFFVLFVDVLGALSRVVAASF